MARSTPSYTKLRTTMTMINVNDTEPNLLPILLNSRLFVPVVITVYQRFQHANKTVTVTRCDTCATTTHPYPQPSTADSTEYKLWGGSPFILA